MTSLLTSSNCEASDRAPWTGAPLIRVVLPYHLRMLAGVEEETAVQVEGTVTQESLLDAWLGDPWNHRSCFP